MKGSKLWTFLRVILLLNSAHGHHNSQSVFGGEKENYFLPEAELQEQMHSFQEFMSGQMEIAEHENRTIVANYKLNISALGFPDLTAFRQIFSGYGDIIKRDAVCSGCQVLMGVLIHQIRAHGSDHDFERDPRGLLRFTVFTCTFFRLAHPDVCRGILDRLAPPFVHIVAHREELTPSIICGVLFQSLGCRIPANELKGSEFDWKVEPLKDLTPFVQNRGQKFNGKKLSKDGEILKIVQLADIHIDYDYKEGTMAACENEVLCCQERFGYPPNQNSSEGAGHFGDNRKCDPPPSILHLALKQLRDVHGPEISAIYVTGDLVPHNIWYTTREGNSATIAKVSKTIAEYFPNTVIVPCLGNHETHAVNLFSPTSLEFGSFGVENPIPYELRTDWVYSVAYEAWAQWIPEEGRETFLKAGYYALDLNPKFRIIVLNTNVCYGFNLWQLYSPRDPGGQLAWLQIQLERSQWEGKTVHILSHVPPGHEDCFKSWSREFYQIVGRYRSIIRAQFYGHTHYDEFRIFHDQKAKNVPFNVMWLGPSLTPYRIQNPGYRIYHVGTGQTNDHVYGDVLDHETYIYDLTTSNADYKSYGVEAVFWFRLYRATEFYKLPNLLPANLKRFVSRMAVHRPTFDRFYQFYFKGADVSFEERDPCDTYCQKRILCGMVMAYYDDEDGGVECDEIQREVDGVVLPIRVLEQRKKFVWL